VNPLQVVRVTASVRLPSGHGPDVDYEIVQAVVRAGTETKEAVFLRLVVGDVPQHDRVAEVLVQDLAAVQAQWTRFVQDVLWRRGEGAPATPVISASGGRFGGAVGDVPVIPAKKEKKRTEPPPQASFEEAAFEAPKTSATPEQNFVIGFNVSAAPTADGLMQAIQSRPKQLVVVAPMVLVPKVQEYLKGLKGGSVQGDPTDFTPVPIRRDPSMTSKKLRAQVAGGIAQVIGNLDAVLWVTPE
jgi:hypothetical protein